MSKVRPLWANQALSSRGVALHGAGFIVTPEKAAQLGLGRMPGLEQHILDYRNGRDLGNRPRGVKVIDLFGLSAQQVRDRYPDVYQHLVETVKPERDDNNREYRRVNWWLFGENIPLARQMIFSLPRYIATAETAKHRFFQFLDASIIPDNKLLAIGTADPEHLATLSSRLSVCWSIQSGGWMGVGNDPVYVKTRCFDPFPFPDLADAQSRTLADLGERLDAFRKDRLAAHPHLTMTGLYNALERLRELTSGAPVDPWSDAERDTHETGQIQILRELHDDIDREVLAAYGWSDLAPALVGRPGGTTPSPHKTPEQEAAEETLLSRLVDLNQSRAAAEAQGDIHWLRPDYQKARLAGKYPVTSKLDLEETEAAIPQAAKPSWPIDGLDQIKLVRDVLAQAATPLPADAVNAHFKGGRNRRARVDQVLVSMAETGLIRAGEKGGYFLPR